MTCHAQFGVTFHSLLLLDVFDVIKYEVFVFNRPQDIEGAQNLKISHVTKLRPFGGIFIRK